jgi:hypothetical protein
MVFLFVVVCQFGSGGGATLACGRGGGKSQFGRGDRHCGSIGIYVYLWNSQS